MKNMLRFAAVLTLVCLLLTGCFAVGDKEYSCQELTMTVPGYMSDESDDKAFADFTFALDSYKIAIFGLKEAKADFKGTTITDLKSYTDLLIVGNDLECTAQTREGKNYRYFYYTADNSGTTYGYVCATYEAADAYWLVQVAAEKDNYDVAEFLEILDTVVLN